jgi:hypothetical protein
MGAATEAAIFAGSTGQALYILDTGVADPLRIRTGSFGCWFRTAKRGINQFILSKWGATVGTQSFVLYVNSANVVTATVGDGTTQPAAVGTTDVADDRWHFAVATHDGTKLRLYVDGVLEATVAAAFPIVSAVSNFNIGGANADGATAATSPFFGRTDEAFVTSDVLSDDQVRNLYCARVAHALAVTPADVRLAVRRRRRGGPVAVADFPAQPIRLHNFTAGAVTDQGSGGVALTPNPGTGAIVDVAGGDGATAGAKALSGAHTGLSSTDAGLPNGTTSRSFGAWFKTGLTATAGILGWGTTSTADARLAVPAGATGTIVASSGADVITGPVVADGMWHHAVVVEEFAPADGVKRKLYLDGRLVGISTVLNALTLAGANRFRVGANPDATAPFTGQIDSLFVYAGALTPEQVRALYNVGSQALAPSQKNAGDHVEAIEAASLLATFDTLDGCDQIDLGVAA